MSEIRAGQLRKWTSLADKERLFFDRIRQSSSQRREMSKVRTGQLREWLEYVARAVTDEELGPHPEVYLVLEPAQVPQNWDNRWWVTTPDGQVFTRLEISMEFDEVVAEADDA